MENKKLMAQIAVNKSLQKEYKVGDDKRVVYLNDGTEFQIQLFNYWSFTVGAEIYINGHRIAHTLVLKPGERIWLERYLDEATKFKFETYEVDANDEDVDKAIEKNGEVKIKFYKEEDAPYYTTEFILDKYINKWDNKSTYSTENDKTTISTPNTIDISSTISTDTNSIYYINTPITNLDTTNYYCSCDTSVLSNKISNKKNISTTIDNSSINNLNSFTFSASDYKGLNDISEELPHEETKETGRIGKGKYSNQKFDNVYTHFSNFSFNTEIIKLMPISQKQINANDLQKIYCHECGRKLKQNYKFCPYCGSKLD